jgi:hypothetical protein
MCAMGATGEGETELATIIAEGGCVPFAPPEDGPSFPDLWRGGDTARGE